MDVEINMDSEQQQQQHMNDEVFIEQANDIGSSTSIYVRSLEQDIRQGNLFLDPLAAHQLLAEAKTAATTATGTSTSTTSLNASVISSSSANSNSNNNLNIAVDASSSRRIWQLRQRTTTAVPNSEDETKSQDNGAENDNDDDNCERERENQNNQQQQQQQQQDNNYKDPFVSAAKSVFQKPLQHYQQDYSNGNGDDSAYRYLIRMSPTNYRHEESKDSNDNHNTNYANAIHNHKDCVFDGEKGRNNNNEKADDEVFSNASSSVLLPLHPYQRVMAPLPHQEAGGYNCDDNSNNIDIDNSGYTTMHFRDSLLIPEF